MSFNNNKIQEKFISKLDIKRFQITNMAEYVKTNAPPTHWKGCIFF